MSACSLPGDCSNLVKVRLSDGSDGSNGSDGSIGQAYFPSDKKLSDGEKMTSSRGRFNSIRDVCKRHAGDCGKIRLSDGSDGSSDKRVFRRTKSNPMEKK